MNEMENPKISVVILNYQGCKYLKKTIPAILSLDYPNIEFLIVDNGSTDGSINYLKDLNATKQNNKIRIIQNKENLGYSVGKNIGVSKATGDYILLLDNDMKIVDKNALNDLLRVYPTNCAFLQVPLLDVNKEKTSYYGMYFTYYGIRILRPIFINKLVCSKEKLINTASFQGGCCFFLKAKWELIGGFDESQKFNCDDIDIGPRSLIYGYNNYLYTRFYFIHLGINKKDTAEEYSNRYTSYFSGHARSMFKNYLLRNLIIRFPIFFIFHFIKSIRYSFKKRSIKIFFAFIWSINYFLKNFSDTLKQRKIIQSKRAIKDDIFLKIKPPRFD